MRVFVTGATGFIGSVVVAELTGAGHEVLGLARSDASAEALATAGISVHRGSLEDHDSLRAGVAASDGVIHTAFIHDFSQFEANALVDRKAITVMLDALEGSDKPFVAASGTMLSSLLVEVPEGDEAPFSGPGGIRAGSDALVLRAASRGVRSSIVRLPPTVHGRGDKGFIPRLIEIARKSGYAAYIGDGANRWPAVHRIDAAHLFCLGLEKADAGSQLIAAAEEGIPMRSIAETIAKGLGTPVHSFAVNEAEAQFGWMSYFVGVDNFTTVNDVTANLGWHPGQVGLLEDMVQNGYFSA